VATYAKDTAINMPSNALHGIQSVGGKTLYGIQSVGTAFTSHLPNVLFPFPLFLLFFFFSKRWHGIHFTSAQYIFSLFFFIFLFFPSQNTKPETSPRNVTSNINWHLPALPVHLPNVLS
jgi:hypothetical protein